MCKTYKVSNVRYIARLKDGYSKLEALNIIPLLKENTKDVLLVDKIRLEGFVYKKKKELYFACAFNNGTEEILSKSEILKLVI